MKRIEIFLPLLICLAFAIPARAEDQPSPPAETPPSPAPEVQPVPPSAAPAKVDQPITQPMPGRGNLVFNNLAVLRLNALGLEDQARLMYRYPLGSSSSLLFKDNYFSLGFAPKINPAFLKFGPSLEFQPLAFFNLRVTHEILYYFGTSGYLQSFGTPTAVYSDSKLEEGEKKGKNYDTGGHHFFVEPTLQFKFSDVAVRDKFAYEYWNVELEGKDTVFYEATLDTLVPGNGVVLTNDVDVLYMGVPHVTVGLRHSLVHSLYDASDYAAGEDTSDNPNTPHHRLGPLLAYTFEETSGGRVKKPTLILIVNWYLDHRWRMGEDVDKRLPYFVLGYSFNTDLL